MKKKIFLFFISLFALISLAIIGTTQPSQKVQASRVNLKPYVIPAKYRGTWHTNRTFDLTFKKWSKDKSRFTLRITKRYIKGTGWGEPNNYPTYKNNGGNLENKLPYTRHVTLVGNTKNGIYFCYPTTDRTYITRNGNTLIIHADDWKRILHR